MTSHAIRWSLGVMSDSNPRYVKIRSPAGSGSGSGFGSGSWHLVNFYTVHITKQVRHLGNFVLPRLVKHCKGKKLFLKLFFCTRFAKFKLFYFQFYFHLFWVEQEPDPQPNFGSRSIKNVGSVSATLLTNTGSWSMLKKRFVAQSTFVEIYVI